MKMLTRWSKINYLCRANIKENIVNFKWNPDDHFPTVLNGSHQEMVKNNYTKTLQNKKRKQNLFSDNISITFLLCTVWFIFIEIIPALSSSEDLGYLCTTHKFHLCATWKLKNNRDGKRLSLHIIWNQFWG